MHSKINWKSLIPSSPAILDQLAELLQNLLFMTGYAIGRLAEKSPVIKKLLRILFEGCTYGISGSTKEVMV